MRKLASIQIINEIKDIPNADKIKVASVLGWKTVIKNDEFKVNDKIVFCEIDSILPDRPEFAFFRAKGNRLKTMRLRGALSQGVCFPLTILPPGTYEIDADVTDILGIVKYEPPIPAQLAGTIKCAFPSFIPKTDEPRIQLLQPLLDKYKNELFGITEKLDGCSVSYYINNGEFGVCGRNWELQYNPDNTLWKLAEKYKIENELRNLGRNIALQGEIIGEDIQKNPYKLTGQDVYFFNLFDIDTQSYTPPYKWLKDKIELNWVPFLGNYYFGNNMDEWIKFATGRSLLNPERWREGIVCRPVFKKDYDADFGRVSFKVINPEYLLEMEVADV